MPPICPPADTPFPDRKLFGRADWRGLVAAAVIAISGIAVYSRTFSVPLLFDDSPSIVDNPTIRRLWPIGPVLSPPSGGLTVSERPILNLTLALNYALGGTNVWGYHVVNLAIHILSGLTLFGIARRMFRPSTATAFAIALIWTLHPLQTESVTYIIQRAESLMGLFYLLTLYCFIRCAENHSDGKPILRAHLFAAFSIFSCLLGMATKEVMVSAPVICLLYDRTFIAGTFREAWRQRRKVYLGLASTWILLAFLVIGGGGNRGGTMGFGANVSWSAYGLTQFEAVIHYLWLAVWPHPLVFDYGIFWVKKAGQVVPFACLIVPLVAATILALRRWPAWGFCGFWFFAILAPTTLVFGAQQMIAEHRMYLALAPVLMAIIGGGHALMLRRSDEEPESTRGAAINPNSPTTFPDRTEATGLIALIVFAGICCVLTVQRNDDYRSALSIWADTVAKRPDNARAHNNLGFCGLNPEGRTSEAIAQYEAAVRLRPDYADAQNNLGMALYSIGRFSEALPHCEAAVSLRPTDAKSHLNLGMALAAGGGGQPSRYQRI